MVKHEETTPRDGEDRNAPITAAENQPHLEKQVV